MTTYRALPAHSDESVSSWDRALYAFLAEKEHCSGVRLSARRWALG